MTEHATRRRVLASLASVRTRAVLSLGIVLGLASVSTLAFWSDSAQLTTGAIQTAKLDLKLDGADNQPTSGKLAIANMIPGESVAGSVAVQRVANTIAFTYTATAAVATSNELTEALRFKLYAGTAGTVATSGTGVRTQACGGTQLWGGTDGLKLTATATSLVTGRTTLAAPLALSATDQVDNLCVQATLPTATDNTAQSKSAAVNFSFTATQLS